MMKMTYLRILDFADRQLFLNFVGKMNIYYKYY